MKNIKENILNKIKKENIKPTSKNIFVAKNIFFWILVLVSLLLGALTFSAILFELLESFGPVHKIAFSKSFASDGFLLYLITIPYIWTILLLVFITISYLTFKKTENGYKKSLSFILSISIVLSMILGFAFFKTGVGNVLEKRAQDHFPSYKKQLHHRQELFKKRLEKRGIDPKEFIEKRRIRKFLKENKINPKNIRKNDLIKIKQNIKRKSNFDKKNRPDAKNKIDYEKTRHRFLKNTMPLNSI